MAFFFARPLHHSLMPHWLTHWEPWGFSPLPSSTPRSFLCLCPAALTCCYSGWWRTVEILGCSPHWPSPGALSADTLPGTSGAEEAKRHCTATCRRAFLGESRVGGASPHPCRVSSRRASSADSVFAVCACRWRAGRLAPPLPGRLWCGSNLALLLIAWLGVVYGRHAIRMWSGTLQKWSTPLICVFVGLLVAGICFGIWKVSGLRKSDAADKRGAASICSSGRQNSGLQLIPRFTQQTSQCRLRTWRLS